MTSQHNLLICMELHMHANHSITILKKVWQMFLFVFLFANTRPNILISICIGPFWSTQFVFIFALLFQPNLFVCVFALFSTHINMFIHICQKILTQIYLYFGLKIVFITHCIVSWIKFEFQGRVEQRTQMVAALSSQLGEKEGQKDMSPLSPPPGQSYELYMTRPGVSVPYSKAKDIY